MSKRKARPFSRPTKDASVVGGSGGNLKDQKALQMQFDFVEFIHTELDKLRSKVDNSPHAIAQIAAIQAVVAYHRARRKDNSVLDEYEGRRRVVVGKVASREDDGNARRDHTVEEPEEP